MEEFGNFWDVKNILSTKFKLRNPYGALSLHSNIIFLINRVVGSDLVVKVTVNNDDFNIIEISFNNKTTRKSRSSENKIIMAPRIKSIYKRFVSFFKPFLWSLIGLKLRDDSL